MFEKVKTFVEAKGGWGTMIAYYLKQPSTKKGIILLAGVIGYSLDPTLVEQIATGVISAIALVEVARDEKKK